MQAWADVALLTKAKTHIGGFVVRCTAGLSFFLEPGMELSFVPPRIDCPRSARITSVNDVRDLTAVVTFDGFETMQQTCELVGAHCLIRREDLEQVAPDDADLHLTGLTVIDEELGELGPVVDVVSNPGQDLLVVDCESTGRGEVMIPYVDAFIRSIDGESGIVSVSIPAGLLDL